VIYTILYIKVSMLEINKKILFLDTCEVHFSDYPYDVEEVDFLNFRYCKNKVNVKGFNRHKELTSIIDLTQDLDTIWKNMDKKNVRYRINRAKREGIEIQTNKDYKQFFEMYKSFIKKKGIKSLFDIFGVGSIDLKTMKEKGTLFVAKYYDELLVGTLFLKDNQHIESWIGASKRLDVDKRKKSLIACADRLIDWEAIKYAKERGIKEFDLGGLWSKKEAEKDIKKKRINDYKLYSGGKTVTRYSYQKSYSKTYDFLCYLYSLKNLQRKKS